MTIYEASLTYKRVGSGQAKALDDPAKVVAYMKDAFANDPTVEWFYVVLLNRKNFALGRVMVSKGTATSSLVHPREVYKPALVAGCCSVIAVHNHPSGDPSPSSADIQVTRRLREAGKLLDIELLDHIVIGEPHQGSLGFYSFRDSGLL